MKKFLLMLLMVPLLLFSCGKMKIYGHYAFQMGGDKSTHFGVFLDLTKEQVKDEKTGKVLGEKFNFGMKISEDAKPEMPETDDPNFLEKAFAYLFVEIMNVEGNPDAGLDGYFNVDDKYIEDKGKRLFLTVTPFEMLIPDLEEILEMLIVAYVDGRQIQLIMPVSLADFQYQLCWYGLFIYPYQYTIGEEEHIGVVAEDLLDTGKMPGPQILEDRIGTHPTKEQIEDMNSTFSYIFIDPDYPDDITGQTVNINFTFRDCNSLTIDLLKS